MTWHLCRCIHFKIIYSAEITLRNIYVMSLFSEKPGLALKSFEIPLNFSNGKYYQILSNNFKFS